MIAEQSTTDAAVTAPASQQAIRVLVADDHAVVREGIRQVLSVGGFEVIGEAATAAETLALARRLEPDVVILDISMPDGTGLDVTPRLREVVPDTRILILSIHDHEQYVLQSVRAGAHGYLRKDSSPGQLRDAVRAVHQGATFFSGPVADQLAAALRGEDDARHQASRLDTLTTRERDVLVEIAGGFTNKEIAARLGISARTVESHRESLMRKLLIRNVAGLTRFAVEKGLLPR
jgi:DNA-binding NarL/FixJ family response regulator